MILARLQQRYFLVPAALTILFLGFGLSFARETGTFRAPDERMHYYYIETVSRGRLPVVTDDRTTWEAHQPPLYYLKAQAVFQLTKGMGERTAVMSIRIWSLLLGALTIWCTFLWVRMAWPGNWFMPTVAASFAALNPQFIYMNSVINNDSLTNLMASFVLLMIVMLLTRPVSARTAWVASFTAAAAWMTKAVLWPMSLALLAILVWKYRSRDRLWLLLPAAAAAIWWGWRNTLLYGDPIASSFLSNLWSEQHRDWLTPKGIRRWLRDFYESFWGRFGYFTLGLRRMHSHWLKMFGLILSGGFLVFLWRDARRLAGTQRQILLVGLGLTAAVITGTVVYSLNFYQPQGRYLFPVLGMLGLLAALGLQSITPKRAQPFVAAVMIGVLLWFDWQSYLIIRRYG